MSKTKLTLLIWLVWVIGGALVFGLPGLLGRHGAVEAALQAASQPVQVAAVIWLFGPVTLLTRVFHLLFLGMARTGAQMRRGRESRYKGKP